MPGQQRRNNTDSSSSSGGFFGGVLDGIGGGIASPVMGLGSDIASGWNAATDWVGDTANDLTSWHFEGRDARNVATPSEQELESSRDWRRLGETESIYHQNGGAEDAKYVADAPAPSDPTLIERMASWFGPGGYEAVIDGDTHGPMEAGPAQATYNYVNPAEGGMGDTSWEGIKANAGHMIFDVLPFWFGGNVRGEEGTNFAERVLGPDKYGSMMDTVNGIGDTVSNGWNTATDWVGDRANDVATGVGSAVDWAGDRANDVANGVGSAVDWAGEQASNIGSGISSGVDAAAGWVGSFFD